MNAGTDYHKARKQAQANADYFGVSFHLFSYGGTWWVERCQGIRHQNALHARSDQSDTAGSDGA